jgi:peptidoglycan/LPS O-acetylase OafA/YrhL
MKLNSIQFLRAVAAILVVYEHSMNVQVVYNVSAEQNFFHLRHFACIGVDLFFVISGFIITYIANKYNGYSQGLYFLAKRFCRINPVYYLATLIYFAATTLRTGIPSVNGTLLQAANSILIFPTTAFIGSFSPLLIVGWTLAFEWFFYMLFFSSILLKIKRKAFYMLGIIGTLVLIGRILHFYDLRLIFITNPMMLEFLLGIIICYSYLYIKRIPAFTGSILLGFGLIAYILMIILGHGDVWNYYQILSGNQSFNRFLYWGIPSSLIVAGSVIMEKNGKLTSAWLNQYSILLGDASYSIYLSHFITLDLMMLFYSKANFIMQADLMIWVQVIMAVTLSIVFYKKIEKPLLQYINKSCIWDSLFTKKTTTTKGIVTDDKQLDPSFHLLIADK